MERGMHMYSINPEDFVLGKRQGYGLKLSYDAGEIIIFKEEYFDILKVNADTIEAAFSEDVPTHRLIMEFVRPDSKMNYHGSFLDCFKDPSCGLVQKDSRYVIFPDLARARQFAYRVKLIEEIKKKLNKNIYKMGNDVLEEINSQID